MILGGLIGVLTWIVKDADPEDKDSEKFNMQEVFIVLVASGITLLVLGTAEVLIKVFKSSLKTMIVSLIAALGLACFLLSGYLCSEFCAVWSILWTYSLLVGIAFEVLLSQSLRAFIKTALTN
mmetsp:Transcript_10933/g.16306  ORF Transcript_10933/g.16306 Transcript_10933/m.16306 type:complete len:123 (+) Transcript_10933:1-369(+)